MAAAALIALAKFAAVCESLLPVPNPPIPVAATKLDSAPVSLEAVSKKFPTPAPSSEPLKDAEICRSESILKSIV